MKTLFRFTCLLLMICFYATITIAEAKANNRIVQLIYFVPSDEEYSAEIAETGKNWIKTVQTFYADQMESYGYGRKTFQFETDAQGEPMFHRIDGQHPTNHYRSNSYDIQVDINPTINLRENVSLVIGPSSSRGHGAGWGKSGLAVVRDSADWNTVAHELGHAFGLQHDFRDGRYIMSYGQQTMLSKDHADFLSVHPAFNMEVSVEDNPSPVIELISPDTYQSGTESISIKIRVIDIDGVHQVILFANSPRRYRQVKEGRKVAGEIFTEVEFDFDGIIPTDEGSRLADSPIHDITIGAVDRQGNMNWNSFYLMEISPYHTASLKRKPLPTEPHRIPVNSVAFSPNEQIIAGGAWDNVMLWDLTTHSIVATLPHQDGGGSGLSFSSDGTMLAVDGGGHSVKLWNMTTKQSMMSLEYTDTIGNMALSPNDAIIAAGVYDNLILWAVATGDQIATIPHQGWPSALAFSSDSKMLATSESYPRKAIRLWDVATVTEIATILDQRANTLAFSPNGDILISADYNGIKIWDVETREKIKSVSTPSRIGWPNSISFSPDGKTFAIANSRSGSNARTNESFAYGTIQIWEAETLREITAFAHTVPVYSVSFSPDGNLLAAGTPEGTIEIWDATEWKWPNYSNKILFEYTLSVSSGSNFIHIPLRVISVDDQPQNIETISDVYDALGGADSVNFLRFYDTDGQEWINYAGNQDKGTIVDHTLTDDKGIFAIMNSSVSVKLSGYALGTNGNSSITLHAGVNLVGIPLRDPRINRVSDLYTIDGIKNNVSISVLDNGLFKLVAGAGDDGNILVTRGQSFMLIAQRAATVIISGNGWDNTTGAAPLIANTNIKPINQIETSLLLNYPNPFNPETWIPFRLAEDTDVTLDIYDASGRLVRNLDIGHTKTGIYESRDKAIL